MAICSVLLMVMVMMVNETVGRAAPPPPPPPAFPVYDETFSVDTAESTPGVGVVLRQTIVHDWTLRRSMMKAEGSLVRGVLQQILRCVIDVHNPMHAVCQVSTAQGSRACNVACTFQNVRLLVNCH
jgi:hypothetical protein